MSGSRVNPKTRDYLGPEIPMAVFIKSDARKYFPKVEGTKIFNFESAEISGFHLTWLIRWQRGAQP